MKVICLIFMFDLCTLYLQEKTEKSKIDKYQIYVVSETETSQKKSDSTRLDSVLALLDSARLDTYFKKTLLDSTRLDSK